MSTPSPSADRNLLFGILALQMDFIDREALIAAMHAWVLEKSKPLGQILVEHLALGLADRDLLEAVVQRHLQMHGNDAQRSLAVLSSPGSLRDDLRQVADVDVQTSLAHVSAAGRAEEVPRPTVVGQPSVPGVRFRILREHAKGGLGAVFVAHDEELHRQVALKEIQEQYAHLPESRARFLLEAEVTGGLEHPGVVPVYGLGRYPDGRPFYAMRFIKGDSLHEAIRRFHAAEKASRDPGERSLAFRELLGRFVAACNALAYAHARGVLHRDVKPRNIMLGKYGETLVVDWGLAKVIGHREGLTGSDEGTLCPASGGDSAPTQAGKLLGTPPYMSPEQAEGRLDDLGPASDIYNLGATLYDLLTGRAPIEASELGPCVEQIKRGDWLPPRKVHKHIPPALEAVCLKAMARKPEDRYPTALALAADVEHWLADEPVAAYHEPWTGKLRRWGRRHQPVVAAAAALLLTALVLLAVGIILINQEKDRTTFAYGELEREQQRTQQALGAEAKRRQQTRAALDLLSSEVIDDWLARQKELLPTHREFLVRALASYEELARDTGEDESTRAGVARAQLRVGAIRRRLGRMAEAEAAYLRSCALYQQLAADFPSVPQYRLQLAGSRNNLGLLLQQLGKRAEAESAYRDALQIQVQLAQDFPTVPDYRLELAGSHLNLGSLLHVLGKGTEAERAYREALKIYGQLAEDFPSVPQYRQELAKSHNNLGSLLADLGKRAEAESAYGAALKIRTQLAHDFPAVPDYRQELARSHYNLGILLRAQGKRAEAERAYREALKIQTQLAQEFPAVPRYRQELGKNHYNLGVLLRALDKQADAESAFREALKFGAQLANEFPTVPDYQNELAWTLDNLAILLRSGKEPDQARKLLEQALPHHRAALKANDRNPRYRESFRDNRQILAETFLDLGDHTAAADAAGQLIQVAVDPANDVYNAACFLARCVPLAEGDSKLAMTQRQERAQAYADRAMATLRQAVQNGYKDAAHMKKDTDLDPLRSREDFQKLVKELEDKVVTGAK